MSSERWPIQDLLRELNPDKINLQKILTEKMQLEKILTLKIQPKKILQTKIPQITKNLSGKKSTRLSNLMNTTTSTGINSTWKNFTEK